MSRSPRIYALYLMITLILSVFFALITALTFASLASAAPPVVAGEQMEACSGGRGSGERDNAGNMYLTCQRDAATGRPSIRVYNTNGDLAQRITPPAIDGNAYFNAVAPSPDASFLYVSTQSHKFYRLKRQGGTYVHDLGFRFEDFPYGPLKKTPMGEFLSVDGKGNIYLANGTWVAEHLMAPMTVVKYSPEGRFITRFGDWGNARNAGEFYWMLAGVAVTPDGVNLYTTEVGNNRVQRWEKQFNAEFYAPKEILGNTAADDRADDPRQPGDQSRQTICGVPGKFGAPYDSALDVDGNLYVLQTNCHNGNTLQVHRRDSDGSWAILSGPKFTNDQAHGMAIDAKGNIYAPQVNAMLRVTVPATPPAKEPAPDPEPQQPNPDPAPNPAPAPGPVNPPQPEAPPAGVNQAPVLNDFQLPQTTAANRVTLTINAQDDRAVTQMRFATEDGNWRAWQPFVSPTVFDLTPGAGARGVFVQVRDAQGAESNVLYKTTRVAPGEAPAPDPVPEPQPQPDPVPAPDPAPQPDPVLVPHPNPAANVAPTLRGVTVPEVTPTRAIEVAVDAIDDHAVTEIRFATEDGNWHAWQRFTPASQFTLSAGAGFKGVFVQVRDAQRAESTALYRTLTYAPGAEPVPPADQPAPQPQPEPENPPIAAPEPDPLPVPIPVPENPSQMLQNVMIPAITTTQTIPVNITVRNGQAPTQMRFASEDGNWGAWQPYRADATFTLSAGFGLRGVFVQLRDAQRNESNIIYQVTRRQP